MPSSFLVILVLNLDVDNLTGFWFLLLKPPALSSDATIVKRTTCHTPIHTVTTPPSLSQWDPINLNKTQNKLKVFSRSEFIFWTSNFFNRFGIFAQILKLRPSHGWIIGRHWYQTEFPWSLCKDCRGMSRETSPKAPKQKFKNGFSLFGSEEIGSSLVSF